MAVRFQPDFSDSASQRTPMALPRERSEAAPTAGEPTMIDLNHIDDLARRLSGLVPPGLKESQDELQQTFKSALQAGLGKLDLVTREEFDVQRAVLLRTREKLEALERAVAALETPASTQPPQH
jgi:BMFP domain-containing protein YqiC